MADLQRALIISLLRSTAETWTICRASCSLTGFSSHHSFDRPAFAKSCYEHGPLGGAVGAGKRAEGMGSPPILCCYLVGRENTLGCTHWGQCKKKKILYSHYLLKWKSDLLGLGSPRKDFLEKVSLGFGLKEIGQVWLKTLGGGFRCQS